MEGYCPTPVVWLLLAYRLNFIGHTRCLERFSMAVVWKFFFVYAYHCTGDDLVQSSSTPVRTHVVTTSAFILWRTSGFGALRGQNVDRYRNESERRKRVLIKRKECRSRNDWDTADNLMLDSQHEQLKSEEEKCETCNGNNKWKEIELKISKKPKK